MSMSPQCHSSGSHVGAARRFLAKGSLQYPPKTSHSRTPVSCRCSFLGLIWQNGFPLFNLGHAASIFPKDALAFGRFRVGFFARAWLAFGGCSFWQGRVLTGFYGR